MTTHFSGFWVFVHKVKPLSLIQNFRAVIKFTALQARNFYTMTSFFKYKGAKYGDLITEVIWNPKDFLFDK